MRIAQVAPMYEAVPPLKYGGTERVVSYLTEELVRLGHDVTLFASGDSRTTAKLVPTTDRALRVRFTRQEMEGLGLPLHLAMLSEVFQRASEFDIIHSHVDYLPFGYEPLVDTPVVTTLHGRLDLPFLLQVFAQYPRAKVISISNSQRAPLHVVKPIGLALSIMRCRWRVSRLTQHQVITCCSLAGLPLKNVLIGRSIWRNAVVCG